MKLDILAIGVHPDDIELSCAGTLLKHLDFGHKVGILDLTRGELGTRGNADIRLEEATAAKKYMGIQVRDNLGMADGFFEHSRENLELIATALRHYRPDIVLANALSDRHPDHGRAAKLTADACFLSGLLKLRTEKNGAAQDPWRPKALYHYIQDHNLQPDFVFDISEFMDQKVEAILKFKTQFFNPDAEGPQTPISSKAFLEFIKAKNRTFGRHIGVEFAEGFNKSRDLGVGNLFDLI